MNKTVSNNSPADSAVSGNKANPGSSNQSSTLGRPRSFDVDEALQCALQVFWEKGYEGASLTDLTKAMGINKPSLYSAFGNKEQLFIKAIERYEKRPNSFFYPALEKTTAYEMAEHMLLGAARHMSDHAQPQGCMLIQSALARSESAAPLKTYLTEKRQRNGLHLRERLERAKQEGDLPADADCNALAHYLVTVIQGMSVHATNGATPAEMEQVAYLALQAFPQPD